LLGRPWQSATEVPVVAIAHPIPDIKDPLLIAQACHIDSEKSEHERTTKLAEEVAATIPRAAPFFEVTTYVAHG
jgi:hypothetical protein